MAALLTVSGCSAAEAGADQGEPKKDIEAVKQYLAKNYAGKKWQSGPTAMDSDEIRKAYGKRRFYAVVSKPPLPPGARLPELIAAYQKQLKEYKDFISLTVSIDDKGTIATLGQPADYNNGLMKVASKDDARSAAAAILSLHPSEGLGTIGKIAAADLTANETDKGWTCQGTKLSQYHVEVVFDKAGKCTQITKRSLLPPPPSALPPLRLPPAPLPPEEKR
jgi:hypothetical protein